MSAQESQDAISTLLPRSDEIPGLTEVDSARVFTGEALYRFIDGGADLFLEYGFRRAVAQEYLHAGTTTLEIYEMRDPAAAYGIYSLRTGSGGIPIALGDEGRITPYYLMFWKGRYYVSVAGSDTTPESRRGVELVGRIVDRHINESAALPAIAGLLSGAGLLKKTYFRGILGLSTIYTFDTKDIFRSVDGVSGTYHDHTTILFGYRDTPEAEKAFAVVESTLRTNVRFHDFRSQDLLRTVMDRSGSTICFGHDARFIITVIAKERSTAEEVWKDTLHRISRK